MGDDKANEGVYKFVSDREFKPWDRSNNLKILEAGTLYIAKWTPEGRRRFTTSGDTVPVTATSGTGEWVEVLDAELVDTATLLRARIGATEYDLHFATNRPEDVEVQDGDGPRVRRVHEQLLGPRRARRGAPDRRGRRRPRGDDVHVGGLRQRRADRP